MRAHTIYLALVIVLLSNYSSSQRSQSNTRNMASSTDIPAGNVSGVWTVAGSPYRVNGEIEIPDDSTLTIKPGVEVIFMGHYKFNVQGRLLAIGTFSDSIKFTAYDTSLGWHGIRFLNTPNTNDTSKLVYCSLRYGKANTGEYSSLDRCGGAILIQSFDKVLVSHSLFESNLNSGDISSFTGGAAIFAHYASTIITDCTFLNNTGTTDCAIFGKYGNVTISDNVFSNNRGAHGPVVCVWNTPIISGNLISDNVTTRAGGGIFTMGTNARTTDNIIINNQCFGGEGEGGGIKCWMSDASIIINNTIVFNSATNGGGICCNQNSVPLLINNILWGNVAPYGNQVNLLDDASDPAFLYCDIQGGREGFGGYGAGANYTGRYGNNIDKDPSLINNYRLSNASPCIGAGVDSIEISGIWYHVPPHCFGGNARPSPAGSTPDIGACENLLGSPVVGVAQDVANPREFLLYQNYPNPFNPSTTINYELPTSSVVKLSVYDILAREVSVLVNDRRGAGVHEVKFDGSGLASGVYFYRIQAENYVATRRLFLLR